MGPGPAVLGAGQRPDRPPCSTSRLSTPTWATVSPPPWATNPPDPLDFLAVHGRNLELRGLLAQVIGQLGPDAPGVTAYFRERISRYPMTSTSSLPQRG